MKNLIIVGLLLTGSAFAESGATTSSATEAVSISAAELSVCTKRSTLSAIEDGSESLANACATYCDNADVIGVRKLVNRLSPREARNLDNVCFSLAEEE